MKILLNAKCSDLCSMLIQDDDGISILEYDGYVPSFMPGEHFGDYIELDIDVATGRILNWNTTEAEVKKFIAKNTSLIKYR